MDFVIMLSWRDGLTETERDEALVRRAQWTYPEGMTRIAEHWTTSEAPTVVVIARVDSYRPIWEMVATWQDKFHVEVLPAIAADEGLEVGPGVLASRLR